MEGGPGVAGEEVCSSVDARDVEIAALAARNVALAAENAVLSTRITELEGLLAVLRAQLGRDSSISGRPPSTRRS
ncbi:MAG: hypothetical protein ACRDRH_06490 [Pseudonocardia sp.]